MPRKTREERRKKAIEVLNQARAMELHAIHHYMNQHYNLDDKDYGELAGKVKLIAIDEEQIHCNYFDNVDGHIADLGDTYLAKIAGTPSATGLTPKGFAVGTGEA